MTPLIGRVEIVYTHCFAAFNVRTLNQTEQQTALTRAPEIFKVDVCCVSETHIFILRSPDAISCSRFTLPLPDDSVSSARVWANVGILQRMQAESAPLNWISVNGRLCAVHVDRFVHVNRGRLKCSLFVVSVYVQSDCNSLKRKKSSSELSRLLQSTSLTDVCHYCC